MIARALSCLACIGLVSIAVRVVVPVDTAQRETDGDARRLLEIFLRSYAENDRTATYDVAFVDLNGDGSREAVVYLEGRYLCGSGGCHTLVFRYDRSSYRLISDIPITWPPIRLLDLRNRISNRDQLRAADVRWAVCDEVRLGTIDL